MREIVIKCDRCNEVIDGRPYKFMVGKMDREDTGDIELVRTGYTNIDLCQSCAEELMDTFGTFLANEFVRTESEQEPDAAQPETGGQNRNLYRSIKAKSIPAVCVHCMKRAGQ